MPEGLKDDQKTTEQALRESEERLALALEAAHMGVAEYDFATGGVVVSDTLIRLLGYQPGTVPETFAWFVSHVHSDDRAAVQRAFESATSGAPVGEISFRIARRDGAIRWWTRRGRILPGPDGHPRRLIALYADVTEHRDLEEHVRQAMKLEAIGQLAGGVAHDFNNLLTVITGYAETLLAALEPGDPNVADVVEIRRAAERAAMLTRQLLAFSRKQVLQPEAVDVNEVVRDISTMIGRLISGNIDLKLNVRDTPLTVIADRGQLEQVLLNLAVNARDAMPNGGVLEIVTRVVEVTERQALQLYPMRPGRYVLLSVCDTGTGMTPEVRVRVFEPFFTTKGPGHGTGIGLSTVYGIVKQSGGFVFVNSEPEKGTAFDVYLPYSEMALKQVATGDPGDVTNAARTILLVEDYRRVRELARKVLTRQGYRVLTAASGDDALALAREYAGSIDMLLTDVVMSGISGPDLAGQLQQLRPGVAIVYMSGYAGDTLGAHGIAEDGAAFIEKPFTPAALAQKVREVLAKANAGRTTRAG